MKQTGILTINDMVKFKIIAYNKKEMILNT